MAKKRRKRIKTFENRAFWEDFPVKKYRHDAYFKLNMQDLDFAREFLLWAVPELKTASIDLTNLKEEQESFVDKKMSISSADLLYRVFLNSSKGAETPLPESEFELCIFFLIEHKSDNDRWTGFQLVRYIISIWDQWFKNNRKQKVPGKNLPFVLPIIFYHGEHPYTGPFDLRDSIQFIPELKKYLPNWPFCLIDVGQIREDQLPKNWKLSLLIQITRSIFRKDIYKKLEEFYAFALPHLDEPGAREFFTELLHYVESSAKHNDINIFKEKVSAMNRLELDFPVIEWCKRKGYEMYDSGVAAGIAEGRAEGIASAKKTLINILTKRLGALPESLAAKISRLNELDEINRLSDIALDVPTLDEFKKQLR